MRKSKEILRLHYELGIGVRQIAPSLSLAHSTVSDLIERAKAAGLTWPLPAGLSEVGLERKLYPGNADKARPRSMPDLEWIHRELHSKGVTLQLLWLEYKQNQPDGYQYSQFCQLYRKWCRKLDVVMR